MKENKIDLINEKLDELDWDDEMIPEIMEGFFNSPRDAIDSANGEITDSHYKSLWDSLECDEDELEE